MLKYTKLMNEIELRIKNGEIRPSQPLPSIRELSSAHACSKSTVIRAYAELEKRHLIYSIPQSGYYVVQRKSDSKNHARQSVMDFSSAAPDPEVFPYLDFQHCINKAIDTYKNELFQYGTSQGLPSLLNILTRHLANYQVFTDANAIFVTSGIQQALSILATMPFPNGKQTVLLEQPSYHLFIEFLEYHHIPARGIKRTANGIDLNELEHLFRTGDIKFFYTMPRFQNPLGTSFDLQTKKAIADLAKRYDVYIVEDDYLADLENDSKADPIYAYGSSHVIYLKSYSKILFPGLRVGAAVLPTCLHEDFRMHKKLSDIDSPMLSQAALEIYIQNGMFERHKQKIKNSYYQRLQLLMKALTTENDTNCIQHAIVAAGVHTHLILPSEMNIETLIMKLKKKQVILETPKQQYLAGFDEQQLLLKLSVTRIEKKHIEAGVRMIFEEIRKQLPK
ncbi:GntR family transcriptional regulator [Paenibacillus baekrokdamisoli]|uniref:GntR family transcriptional regulator n=1 Tax=Paenibacillus baekrokdamisoli TaxID=1712516 RepID=A0A3G9IW82_9BACL|nr:PLP-dependent aminotransferase family protein [Paenibacillus baekrokdamisoli]MBB3072102.1 DNA-binding transcriptional MocR family regulator [Paenibacillus baekrokdamisoli]BBH20405.1 GntR family transcriptional regulator [Paenibacillus baekrokdamisoli]